MLEKFTSSLNWNSQTIREHEQNVHDGLKFDCNLCDYKASIKGNLRRHLKANHKKESKVECPVCQFETFHRNSLKRHQTNVHSNTKTFHCSESDSLFQLILTLSWPQSGTGSRIQSTSMPLISIFWVSFRYVHLRSKLR